MTLNNKSRFLLLFACLLLSSVAFGQKKITIKGTIVDAATNEPLSFASVYFKGTSIGADTDLDGKYELSTEWGSDTLVAEYLGYNPQMIAINPDDKNQRVNFALSEIVNELTTIVITGKKDDGYSRKNNPAVELWKNVVQNASRNRPQSFEYFEYDKYEKVQFDLNNISKKMKNKKAFKPFKFIFDYADTSDFTGQTALPIYIREAASKVYYRKNPEAEKEFREGIKITNIEGLVSEDAFNVVTDFLYRDMDIYQDQILIFDKPFPSPLAGAIANASYRFYILDTMEMNKHEVIKLAFTTKEGRVEPVFNGNLYIKNDSTYAVVKAEMTVPKSVNLNFVNDLRFEQEFRPENGVWLLDKDVITIDFSPVKTGLGLVANRSVLYENHLFDVKRENDKYDGSDKVVDAKDVFEKGDEFWNEARLEELSDKELGVYQMIDTLQKVPAFKRITNAIGLLVSGFQPVGPVDIGPIFSFYSFNPVEGFRLRFGGQTNLKFHPKIQLEAYSAYGFGDEAWKYGASIKYSFKEDYRSNPEHYFKFYYQHDVKQVGAFLRFVQDDNIIVSFRRGVNDRMMFLDRYSAEYFLEFENNLSFKLGFDRLQQRALGSLSFATNIPDQEPIKYLQSSEFNLEIRFAPNEQFLKGRTYRTPIFNKYPVFELGYRLGVDGLGGDYNYHHIWFHAFKRFYLSIFGNMRVEVEGGRIFADQLPYFFLKFPRGNQTFLYRTGAFNMMNFMEFANDKYGSVIIEQFFDGLFLNKIPLMKRLKLREVVSFKTVYGGLDDRNNPNKNPELIQFIRKQDTGQPITYLLEDKPYMEASAGLYNIFKFGRIDFVQRLNYLDNPDVPEMFGVKGLGVRFKVSVTF